MDRVKERQPEVVPNSHPRELEMELKVDSERKRRSPRERSKNGSAPYTPLYGRKTDRIMPQHDKIG